MSIIDDRLREASAEIQAAVGSTAAPAERAIRSRHRHRVAWRSTAAALLLLVPVVVFAATRPSDPNVPSVSKPSISAADGSTDPSSGSAIQWSTPQVSLNADQFVVDAAGMTFNPRNSNATVHSDPGEFKSYTTLEVSWLEHNTEMRLNIYFKSDGVDWWSDEIRVYDGQPTGDWVTFTGDFFRMPLDQPYRGDLRLEGADRRGQPVALRFDGLGLRAFLPPQGCRTEPGSFSVEVLYPTIAMSAAPNTGFGSAVRLLDETCNEVDDYNAFRFDWAVGDPSMIAFTQGLGTCVVCRPQRVELTALHSGRTDLTVTVTPNGSETPVATGTMAVVVK
jgi:hypothetical protein